MYERASKEKRNICTFGHSSKRENIRRKDYRDWIDILNIYWDLATIVAYFEDKQCFAEMHWLN